LARRHGLPILAGGLRSDARCALGGVAVLRVFCTLRLLGYVSQEQFPVVPESCAGTEMPEQTPHAVPRGPIAFVDRAWVHVERFKCPNEEAELRIRAVPGVTKSYSVGKNRRWRGSTACSLALLVLRAGDPDQRADKLLQLGVPA